jgi:hypothetical protein
MSKVTTADKNKWVSAGAAVEIEELPERTTGQKVKDFLF